MTAWRHARKNVVAIALSVLMAFIGYNWWRTIYGPRWFANLETNAKAVVRAEQLQTWATNLIASCPTNTISNFTPRDLGSNFPAELAGLSPYQPKIAVFPQSGADSPGFVLVSWSAGAVYGRRGFEIGPPDFTGMRGGTAWKTGVYFFQRN